MADTSSALQPIDLQLLYNAIPGSFIILDPGMYIRHVSNAFLEATLTSRSEVLGQPVLTVFSHHAGDGGLYFQQALQAARDTQQPRTLAAQKCRLAGPDGVWQERYWDWVITPVPAQDGQVAGFILQVTDVTCQQQEQPEEWRNQELLQAIHQNLNDVVWDWDLVTDKIWWSDGFTTNFGYTTQETEPTVSCWHSRIHPDDALHVITGIHQVIGSDLTLWSDVYRFKKKNGEYADVLTRGSVYRDPAGKGYRMIGAMVDITLHQKAEADFTAGDLILLP
jgi:PAS domain S-box-containing protein